MALPRKDVPPRQTVRPDRATRGPIRRTSSPFSFATDSKPEKRVPFKVLAHVHLYPPSHNAGAEWMLHALLRYGKEVRGWDIQVITDHLPERSDEWQGIKVRHDRNVQRLALDYRFCNVVITHLDATRKAIDLSARSGRPLVHMIHNDAQLAYHRVQRRNAALVIYNSEWIKKAVAWQGPGVVLHPPTRIADYETDPVGSHVSLLNLSAAKGASTFYEVARRNPAIEFLGVRGSYGHQEQPPTELPNVEIIDNQADVVGQVYSRTRVLLVPSHYESWGRVAVEAACSGIPSICAPTPGLREAGVAAAYVDPDDTAEWNKQLRRLMRSQGAWEEASGVAKQRAVELDKIAEEQLAETAEAMEALG